MLKNISLLCSKKTKQWLSLMFWKLYLSCHNETGKVIKVQRVHRNRNQSSPLKYHHIQYFLFLLFIKLMFCFSLRRSRLLWQMIHPAIFVPDPKSPSEVLWLSMHQNLSLPVLSLSPKPVYSVMLSLSFNLFLFRSNLNEALYILQSHVHHCYVIQFKFHFLLLNSSNILLY